MNQLPPFSLFTGSKDLPYNVDKFQLPQTSSNILPPFSSLLNDKSEQHCVSKPSSFLPKIFENHPLEKSGNDRQPLKKASNVARKQTSNPVQISQQKEPPKQIKRKQPEPSAIMPSATQIQKLLEKVEELRVLIYNSQELRPRKDIRDTVSQVEFSTKNLKDEFETQKLVNKKLKQEMDVLKNENLSLKKKNQLDSASAKCLTDARESYIQTLEIELSKLRNVNPMTK